MPERVLLIGGDLSEGGGVNRVVRDLATIFSERLGLEVTVLARSDKPATYPFPPGVTVEHRPEAASKRGFWRVLRELSRRDYHHAIGFWHWDNIRIGLAFGLAGKPPILTEHTSWYHPPLKTRVARALAYRSARAVCVLNEVELRHYRKYLRRVVLLPNPVPKLSAPLGLEREKLIVAVGHLIDRKNFRDAIEVMAASGLAADGWRLAIIGSGPERAALQALIQRLGLEEAVRIEAPGQDIASWYARASIMLVTSKIEVFSLVLAEAMAMGVVPLAYAADGPAFLLKDQPELLVSPGEIGALAAKLANLARRGSLDVLREAVQETIRTRFSEEVIAERWRTLFGLDQANPAAPGNR